MSQTDARRAAWRADLHDYGSAALRAAGFADMADEHDAAAELERQYAALMVDLAAAKAGSDPQVLRATKLTVAAWRANRRTNGPARPGVVDNFSEPTDAELIEAGY